MAPPRSSASVDVTRTANIVLVCGSAGSGKSAWVKQETKSHKRVVVWDCEQEYCTLPNYVTVASLPELGLLLSKSKTGRFAYVPRSMDDFNTFCKMGFAWGNCTVIAEEISSVTSPGKAPDGWGDLVRRGRKRGCSIYGVTQRPAESDKTILGNASRVHVGRLTRSKDRAYMAAELDCKQADLDVLLPLEWLEKQAATGVILRGKVKF